MIAIGQAVDNYVEGCNNKVNSPTLTLLLKAVLAGAMIAFGAAAGNVASHAIPNVGLARVASGVVFPMGLMMIVMMGFELFTGDCLMAMAVARKKQPLLAMVRVLVLVFVGNFIGGTLLSAMVYYSGQMNYSSGLLGAYTIKVAMGKTSMSFGAALVSGILCNVLVCAAVVMANQAKDVTGKLVAIFFVIMLFVVEGFEHCVANMYYIGAGLFANMNETYRQVAMDTYGYTVDQLSNLNITNYLVGNLVPVTIGNIIGGAICLGLPLVFFNKAKKEN